MDFTFSKEHQMFRRVVHEFAEQEVRPVAKQNDRREEIDPELIRKLGDTGLLGVPFPQKYGGAGLGEIGYCILMEEIGRVCTSTATLIGAHIGIGAMAIYMGGSEAQKETLSARPGRWAQDCRLLPHRVGGRLRCRRHPHPGHPRRQQLDR